MDTKTFTQTYYVNRENTQSVKWDVDKGNDILPMWVADMDFKVPEIVTEKMKDLLSNGAYGYTNMADDYYNTYIGWLKNRHGIDVKQEMIMFSKGAIDGMYYVINSLTKENDAILITAPVYPPFSSSVKSTGRKLIVSNLKLIDNYLYLDFKDIEKKIKTKNVKMMILCSPHNPGGRLWKKGELEQLFEITHKYGVIVISDEVHHDLIMPDQEFVPSMAIKKYQNDIITICALSKSFNLAMFSHCHVIVPGKKLRDKIKKYNSEHHIGHVNALCSYPTYYCAKYGEEWLDSLCNVIYENYNYLKDELKPYCEVLPLEATYLAFVKFDDLKGHENAQQLLMKECKIRTNAGESFGKGYENWARINLATSLDNIKTLTERIKKLYN